MFKQLGLIGCGLMGGSFALALKRRGLVKHVVGYDNAPSRSLRAQALGVIDEQVLSAQRAASGSDIVLIAVPVSASAMVFNAIRDVIAVDALMMDVGSTKRDVVLASRQCLGSHVRAFIPAHPITGKEVAGVAHADVDLYQDCQVVLTPTAETGADFLQQAVTVWTKLGCRVVKQMTPEQHDAAFAAVSHLPHLIAFAFMNSVINQTDAPKLLDLAGPGFRDFTRIAAGDPHIWQDIFRMNRNELLAQSKMFRIQLEILETAITNDAYGALMQLIQKASTVRAQWTIAPQVLPHNAED